MEPLNKAPDGKRCTGATTALDVLCRHLRRARSPADKLHLLGAAQEDQPWLQYELARDLSHLAEKDVMSDDTLRLIKLWHLHAQGDEAGRDYYLCAFARADTRAEIRDALGIPLDTRTARLVLLITVEGLRGDRVSCGGYRRPMSPALDALASQGTCFPRAYSTAGEASQSFPGIMMSNFFQSFGRSRIMPPHLTTLAEVMSQNGYRTVGINAADPRVSHFYAYDKGFDEFCDFFGQGNFMAQTDTFLDNCPKRAIPPADHELVAIFEDCEAHPDVYDVLREFTSLEGVPLIRHIAALRQRHPYNAADIVKETMGRLRSNSEVPRQFYWLHLMDLSESVTVPFSRLGAFSAVEEFLLNMLVTSPVGLQALQGQEERCEDLYDSGVSYVDMNLQILFAFLSDSGLLGDSLICVTADHGKELLERGRFGHGHDRLTEEVVHVPLIFGGGLAQRIEGGADRPVSTLDIAPTILHVCGIRETPESFLGRSLNDTTPRPVYGQTFYDGAENQCAGVPFVSFDLKPFPRPVRECSKEMFYCIEEDCLVVHDGGRGRIELHRLKSARRRTGPEQPVSPQRLVKQAEQYLASVYRPAEQEAMCLFSELRPESAEAGLRDLGYL